MIYAGKTVEEMSRDELVKCLLHFYAAHVKSVLDMADMIRRITKMEMVISKEDVLKLDWWLRNHLHDTTRGDGAPKYPEWTEFVLTANGYQIPKK